MSDVNKNLLLIFVKNPEEGQVKTRLAKSVGSEKALEVYHRLLEITKSITDQLGCHRQVWYSNFIDKNDLWPNDEYEKHLQAGKNLGDRMKTAFRQAFEQDYENVVIIGSDCAALTKEIVCRAFETLERKECDIVVGPSKDGGYYLLGMSSFYSQLFDGKRWGTPYVLEQTLNQAGNLELSYQLLPELNDIDTVEDLHASGIRM